MFKSILTRSVALGLSCYASTALSGDMVLYMFKDGLAAEGFQVSVDGSPNKPVKDDGSVSFTLGGGDHEAILISDEGVQLMRFTFTAAADENADINIDIPADDEPEVLVETYKVNETDAQRAEALKGGIAGEVYDADTDSVIANATIKLVGTEYEGTTDSEGYFEFSAPRGVYNIVISSPEYGSREVENYRVVSLVDKQTNFALSKNNDDIEEVEVVAKYQPDEFVDKERFSLNVVDVLDAEAMSRFGDSSAGEALKRVAGVSLVGGRYAVVRGLQGRFISSTLNGGVMPSTNPTRREVPLDMFPSSVLGGIQIEKSYTPELPGDTTGGSINMVTKAAPDELVNQLSVGTGFVTGVTFDEVLTYEGSNTDWLGFDDGVRELPTAVDNQTNFGEPGTLNICFDPPCIPGQITAEQAAELGKDFNVIYEPKTKKAEPPIDLSYAYGDTYDIDSGGAIGFYTAVAYSNSWANRQDAVIRDQLDTGTFDYRRSVYGVDLNGYAAVNYEDAEGQNNYTSKTIFLRTTTDTTREDVGIDKEEKNVTDVILQWIENQFISQQFSGEHFFGEDTNVLDWHFTYANTHRYEPDRRAYQIINGNIDVANLERRYADQTENAFDLGVDYAYTADFNDYLSTTFKTGLYGSLKDRDAKIARFGFNTRNFDTAGLTFQEIFAPEEFDDSKIYPTVKSSKTDSYTSIDNILAMYLSTETQITEAWDVLAGFRLESAKQELKYPFKSESDNTYETNEILPVLAVTWRVTEDWQLRGGVSKTLSRPGITERSDTTFYDPETDDEFQGQPDLVISTIVNYDLRAEYYFGEEDSFSIALFYKDIAKPIEVGKFSCSAGACDGYTFANQESATLAGVELDLTTQMFDTGSWSGFVSGNFSYIDSNVILTEATRNSEYGNPKSRDLQGQSDYLANIQFGFDHFESGQQITILANYFSDRIFRVETTVPNKVEEGRIQLDAVYNWNINEDMALSAKALNLTNEAVTYLREDQVVESYLNGITFKVGMDFNF